jgi:hypothetical protein
MLLIVALLPLGMKFVFGRAVYWQIDLTNPSLSEATP